ncbi:hypothetical protein HCTV-15_gp72 [Haloarcula virus HCTV-15]|nr:hypothetical protein HCTV-6_gp72 [Haloarcula virus HCTV-6]UBF22546.1 hypothetical protein HCTV-15_gp72 [Haloarcula virus HCTV-15]
MFLLIELTPTELSLRGTFSLVRAIGLVSLTSPLGLLRVLYYSLLESVVRERSILQRPHRVTARVSTLRVSIS